MDTASGPTRMPTLEAACTNCTLRDICLPHGLTRAELESLDHRLVATRRKLLRGAALFQAGDRFESVYAVWTGFFKTTIASPDGRTQVTGFQLGGELLGLDGIATRRHELDAIALEDSQVCVIPFDLLQSLALEIPSLQTQLLRLISRDLVRHQQAMLQLGSMYAEERLAAFLVDLTQRLHARGFSESALLLRMTREEIGSYLGLTLETVSRTFSKFQADGLLFVRNRQIRITDPVGMRHIVEGATH